jgi:hypothetical protein
MAIHPEEPWELGGQWYRDFDWASLNKTHRPQGGGHRPRYADSGVVLTLLKHVEEGLPLPDAARLAGIHPSVVYEWRATIPAIAEALKSAEAKLKQRMVAHITKAAPTNWAAAMTLLERRFPEEFGRRDRVRHEHAGQIGLQLAPAKMDVTAIMMAATLEERLAAEDRKAGQEQSRLPEHKPTL